ncbi:hypothetical protein [Chryseobacterium sp. Leaf394]|uniref:hypothetical protein n=1 Tax=Chryseobacterium sp. Leaf394 TaxID=1736361 RepID=UPI0006FE9201|nr:hypothetical protein [Chryseobacterium sp. Leaf394]KQS91632.1 hypothetical protein ASG21_03960 [Chryseobacterium sp. Leaf394]
MILLTVVIPSLCTIIKAQQEGIIVIGNGAEIYSNDIHFNKNILSAERQELVLKSDKSVTFSYKFVASGSTKIRKSISKFKSKNLRKRKDKIFSEKTVENALPESYKLAVRKRVIINAVPSPSQFVSSSQISKAYVVPGGTDNSNLKASTTFRSFSVTLCLDFLHFLNYHDYSSKSLSALFFKVYTVRPPPKI